jgi:imidazolonepropionase-like amidohydrolase
MRRVLLFLALSLTAAAQQQKPAIAAAPAPDPPVTAIRAGVLIDGRTAEPRRDQVILIRGNRIAEVGDARTVKIPPRAQFIDLSKATVLPGLIDTHTHIFLQGYVPDDYDTQLMKHSMAFRAARAAASARRTLEQGFTTIRDLETEGAGYGDVGIKQAIEAGHIPGPRMFVVTRAISTTGGYPLHGYAPEVEVPKGVQIVDGPVEARKAAREQMENGADWIKVYMTHRSWLDRDGNLVSQPTLTMEEIEAITHEVHGWGRKVACHAYGGEGLHRALAGGCDSIEHGLDLDDASIQTMVKKGIWYVPTLSPYYDHNAPADTPEGKRDRKRVEVHIPSFKKAMVAGVKIAFGTDAGGFPWHEPMAQEFSRMVELGMTPAQALLSATKNASELLDKAGELGVVAPGAYADVIAVEGDPLRDIEVMKNVTFVMKDGKVFKK